MSGKRISTISTLLTLTATGLFSAGTEYFPLIPGNSYVYQVQSGPVRDTKTIEVGARETIDGREYVDLVFFGKRTLARIADDGTLFAYDKESKEESAWFRLSGNVGDSFTTGLDTCTKSGRISSKSETVSSPVGQFSNALALTYEPSCADGGILSQAFLPQIGLLRHTESSISGPRDYALVYARSGPYVLGDRPVSFSIGLEKPVFAVKGEERIDVTADLALRNTSADPILLKFTSGQSYDLRIKDAKGETVYIWSADKLFVAIVRSESFGPGERRYQVTAPGLNLPSGNYIAEGYLTTEGTEPPFRASVGFEVRRTP